MICRECSLHYISEFTVSYEKCHVTCIFEVRNEFIILNVKNAKIILDLKN